MLEKMIAHLSWSNGVMLDWLAVPGNADEDLMRLASHILYVQRLWIRRVQGAEHERDTFKLRWMAELRELAAENAREMRGLIASDVKRMVDYRMMNGTPMRTRVEDILLHACTHGFHHFGQMAAMAAKAGKKLPDVSYLALTRL